jgi:hypothetical protein
MGELPPSPGTDWTDHERTQIERLESMCRDIDQWELECLHTDEGDPWCVVYDLREHRIVLHIARIERRYILAWPHRERSLNTGSMDAAIDVALTQLASMRS